MTDGNVAVLKQLRLGPTESQRRLHSEDSRPTVCDDRGPVSSHRQAGDGAAV